MCRRALDPEDMDEFCIAPRVVPQTHAEVVQPSPFVVAAASTAIGRWPWLEERRAERAFRCAARRAHLKYCPGCRVMIEKGAGDNWMRCQCGRAFNWRTAEHVVPCNRVHFGASGGSEGFERIFGHTCCGCSGVAKMKLAAVRATQVAVGVPVAVSAVIVATMGVAVVAVVPAVVCGPPALAYEPVRRVQRPRKPNPFVAGMGAGVSCLAGVFASILR